MSLIITGLFPIQSTSIVYKLNPKLGDTKQIDLTKLFEAFFLRVTLLITRLLVTISARHLFLDFILFLIEK